MIGAHVAGFPAHVVDRLLHRHVAPLLAGMSPGQRREMEQVLREVRAAADHWTDHTSAAGGSAAVVDAAIEASSLQDELSITEAAEVLGVKERRVRQLAVVWEAQGMARKVGQAWLLDPTAVLAHRDDDSRRSA